MGQFTKIRIYGVDTEFLGWVRHHPELSSRTGSTRMGVQDVDTLFHQFMSAVDRVGTRDIQSLMIIETKTRGGKPDSSQQDSWWKLNWFKGQKTRKGQIVRFCGVYILVLSGLSPADSVSMLWGAYSADGGITYREINEEQLVQILKCEIHPRSLQRNAFRRHHKTQEIAIQRQSALGFTEFQKIVKTS